MGVFLKELGSAFQELSFPASSSALPFQKSWAAVCRSLLAQPHLSYQQTSPCWRTKSAICIGKAYSVMKLQKLRDKSCHSSIQNCFHLILCSLLAPGNSWWRGQRAINSQTEPDMQPSCDTHTSPCWRWLPGRGDMLSLERLTNHGTAASRSCLPQNYHERCWHWVWFICLNLWFALVCLY